MSIDLNDTVEVTLTKIGADILNAESKRLNDYFKGRTAFRENYKEGDVYKNSLWVIITDFGKYCQAGQEAVFKQLRKV